MVSCSIIIPCYNAAPHLHSSIGSVLAQTKSDFEIIAVNDGSTDNTLEILHSYSDARIRILNQPNQGVSAARNAALNVAQGNYIAFLDADDTWAPDFLNKMETALDQRPDAALAYCGWQNLNLPGESSMPYLPPDYEREDKLTHLLTACPWPIHAALTRRSALLAAGGFDTRLPTSEDYQLWLHIAARAPIVRVGEILAYYHHHGDGQATNNRLRLARNEFQVKCAFLTANRDLATRLSRRNRRALTLGRLLSHGYEAYWRRDLETARAIFRLVLRAGYGNPNDWLYMLPSLLPMALHRRILTLRDGKGAAI